MPEKQGSNLNGTHESELFGRCMGILAATAKGVVALEKWRPRCDRSAGALGEQGSGRTLMTLILVHQFSESFTW